MQTLQKRKKKKLKIEKKSNKDIELSFNSLLLYIVFYTLSLLYFYLIKFAVKGNDYI